MLTLKRHALGILWCTVAAALVGFSALLIIDYGMELAPAAVAREFVQHGAHFVFVICRAFIAPIAWTRPLIDWNYWLAGVVASMIWGVGLYSVSRGLEAVKRRWVSAG